MKAFWRPHRLNEGESILLEHLFEAHNHAVFRDNVSSQTLRLAFACNGQDFTKAAAAALCTLGGLHAPIVQTYEILQAERYIFDDDSVAVHWMTAWDGRSKIPGWGSGFVKNKPDPYVEAVLVYIETGWSWMYTRIQEITDQLHKRGKDIYPNMACITAATGVILGLPKELTPALLLHGRSLAWAELLYATNSERPSPA